MNASIRTERCLHPETSRGAVGLHGARTQANANSGFWPLRAIELRGLGNARRVRRIAADNRAAGSDAAERSFSDIEGSSSSKYIKHVIVMIQENRSFDDFFANFQTQTELRRERWRVDGQRFGR